VDIDACSFFPCNLVGISGPAACADIDSAANSTEGRTCTCSGVGVYYESDLVGCVPLPLDNSTIEVSWSAVVVDNLRLWIS
jgi:hypothetical protein